MESMQATLDAAKRHNAEWANFYCAMAYPGTELHAQAVRQGVPLPSSWEGYGQYSESILPMPTAALRPEEILRFRDEAFREYFDRPAYWSRLQSLFGDPAVAFVREILRHKLRRKLLVA
jgi:anaerobic magnesium-protoporphyrin IX monomethyl ester cyclase